MSFLYILKNIILLILKNNNNNIFKAFSGTFYIEIMRFAGYLRPNPFLECQRFSISRMNLDMEITREMHNYCNNNDVIKMRESQNKKRFLIWNPKQTLNQ